ncbi:MAG: RNase P subunit p30 family protein [Candidatus Thorarchaeota archaeon]
MNAIDLDIRISTEKELPKFLEMAQSLGYSAIASAHPFENKTVDSELPIYRRINLESRKLSTLKKQATSARTQHSIVAMPLHGIDIANWAAEDPRIDILTIDFTGKHILRKTTANMSSKHGTALEVSIAPLLGCTGLERSRLIRNIHDSIIVALRAEMTILLSSGANAPIHMRSPVALRHIGMTLGLDRKIADEAILVNPKELITQNLERMNGNRIGPGIEVVKGDDA